MSPPIFGLGVVVLAAGASSRMGTPKLLLPWGGATVLAHLLAVWRKLGAEQIGVVCAANNPGIHDELDRLGVSAQERIINPHPEQGMFSSVQAAAKWSGWRAGLTHWAIVLGDQPQLSDGTLRRILAWAAEHRSRICQPSYHGRPRHPVILDVEAFARLTMTTAPILKEFLNGESPGPELCEVDDPGLEIDLDTPADYQAAVQRYQPRPTREPGRK